MASEIRAMTHPSTERAEPHLSEAAQKFLQNRFIYGKNKIPQALADWQEIRKAWADAAMPISQKVSQAYLQKVEKREMAGVPVLIATPKRWAPAHEDKVLVYMHGGIFALGASEHLIQIFAQVADETGLKVICIDYRLAPEYPFPAGLEDCFSVYRELLNTYSSKNIAFIGDSSGGNLCIATALMARDQKLEAPGVLALFSPFVEMSKGESYDRNSDPHIDYEHSIFPYIPAYAGKEDPYHHPLISLLNADFRGLPALIAQTGSRDALQSDSIRLVEKAKSEGVEATLFSVEGAWHGIVEQIDIPEADMVRRRIAEFIKMNLGIL